MRVGFGLGIAAGVILFLAVVFVAVGLSVAVVQVLVLVGLAIGVVGLALAIVAAAAWRRGVGLARLAETGLRGTAVILEARQTALVVNYSPVVAMRLRVSVPGYDDREVSVRHAFAVTDAVRPVVGNRLAVRVDPDRPDRVAILAEPPSG